LPARSDSALMPLAGSKPIRQAVESMAWTIASAMS
jgi:hypothetical protein